MIAPFLLLTSQDAQGAERVRITSGEWPPYISKDYRNNGFVLDIIERAFKRADLDVEFGIFNWARAETLVKRGLWNGLAIQGRNDKREKIYLFSDVVLEAPLVFMHLKSKPFDWKTTKDLRPFTIGGVRLNSYGEGIEKAAKSGEIKLIRAQDENTLMKLLFLGRVDVAIVNVFTGYKIAREMWGPTDFYELRHHQKPIRISRYYITFDKNNPANPRYANLFNEGLKSLHADGTYERLKAALFKGQYEKEK